MKAVIALPLGALRASWPLLDKDKEANECGVEPLELAESAAKQALEHLDAKVDEARSWKMSSVRLYWR